MAVKPQETSYVHRGHNITIKPQKDHTILDIDGNEFTAHESESGVTCDDVAYMEFGSVQHLAEHLIKQFGTTQVGKREMRASHDHK